MSDTRQNTAHFAPPDDKESRTYFKVGVAGSDPAMLTLITAKEVQVSFPYSDFRMCIFAPSEGIFMFLEDHTVVVRGWCLAKLNEAVRNYAVDWIRAEHEIYTDFEEGQLVVSKIDILKGQVLPKNIPDLTGLL